MSRLSRERIAAEAITLADEEGLDAVSMRRIATRLGVGTMSLYHYVATKHELYTAMSEAIMAEGLIPEGEVPSGWREGLEEIARRARDLFSSHKWVLASWHRIDRGDPGPSLVRHIEQTLAVVAELDFLATGERIELTGLVDEFVIGHVMRRTNVAPVGDIEDRWQAYVAEQASTGEYPHLTAAFAAGMDSPHPDEFERGLQILLDGIEVAINRRRP